VRFTGNSLQVSNEPHKINLAWWPNEDSNFATQSFRHFLLRSSYYYLQGFKYKWIRSTNVLCITFNSIICIHWYALINCWHNYYQITMNMLGKVNKGHPITCHPGIQLYSFFTSALDGVGWPKGPSRRVWKICSTLTRFRALQPVPNHYTNYTIPATGTCSGKGNEFKRWSNPIDVQQWQRATTSTNLFAKTFRSCSFYIRPWRPRTGIEV